MPLIDPVRLLPFLSGAQGRLNVDALNSIDSTNSELDRRARQGAGQGTVIVADEQTAGRGRRGRSWLSDPAKSLTFSLLWRFPREVSLAGLPLAVGLALAQATQRLGVPQVVLKWPNDVLIRLAHHLDAKLAGILIESSLDRKGAQLIIGIGLNLAAPEGEFMQPVAGLAEALGQQPDRHQVLAEILLTLVEVLDAFAVNGFAGLKNDWMSYHAWQDQRVNVQEEGVVQHEGICRGVDAEGALLLETPSGLTRIYAGDVSLRLS